MNDAPIFAALRKIVRRHSNPLEALSQVDIDEMNAALKEARGSHHQPGIVSVVPGEAPWGDAGGAGPTDTGNLGSAAGGRPAAVSGQSKRLADLPKFFEVVRNRFGRLSTSQVQGFEFLLGKIGAAGWPIAWTAYGLATAWHETAQRMQPVPEGLDLSDAWRKKNLRYYPWYGRGYPQTTWEDNYRKADEKLGLGGTLVANPDRMLEPEIAADTMIRGMAEGWFAGDKRGRHTLQRHLPSHSRSTHEQRQEARRIINGTDKRDKIASEADVFELALIAGGWS